MKIIGIDGGATKVSGGVVEKLNDHTFQLLEPVIEIKYSDQEKFDSNFSPISLSDQLNGVKISEQEFNQGLVYVDCIKKVIKSLADDNLFRVSIAMPGVKMDNGRGIKAMVNGPRIPDFCVQIESKLKLHYPIQKLENDSDMCAWGEEFCEEGAFRNIDNVYYIGGGTGTADGLKLQGKLIPFNDISEWIGKTWELKTEQDHSLESFSSMSGINQLRKSQSKDFDLIIAQILGKLLFERIMTIFSGWKSQFIIDRTLQTNHPYQNTFLDRIVIGQRLSAFLQTEEGSVIYSTMLDSLTQMTLESDVLIQEHFMHNDQFDKNRIILSDLRFSPIIGLGAKAWMETC